MDEKTLEVLEPLGHLLRDLVRQFQVWFSEPLPEDEFCPVLAPDPLRKVLKERTSFWNKRKTVGNSTFPLWRSQREVEHITEWLNLNDKRR